MAIAPLSSATQASNAGFEIAAALNNRRARAAGIIAWRKRNSTRPSSRNSGSRRQSASSRRGRRWAFLARELDARVRSGHHASRRDSTAEVKRPALIERATSFKQRKPRDNQLPIALSRLAGPHGAEYNRYPHDGRYRLILAVQCVVANRPINPRNKVIMRASRAAQALEGNRRRGGHQRLLHQYRHYSSVIGVILRAAAWPNRR